MSKKTSNREKGTGTIEKKRNHFYLKLRIGQQCKTTLLLGPDDKPVTTRKDAEAAAARLRPVLRATQKEEIALHIANAKNLRRNTVLDIDHVWSCYLAQPQRPDSAPQTLASYKKSWDRFAKWLRENHIEIRHAGQIDDEIAVEYFDAAWGEHISPRTYNSFRQSLKLIFKHILPVIGLDQNPFNDIRRKSGISESRREFTEEQVKAIFQGFTKGFFYQSEQEVLGPGRERLRKTVTREYVPLYKDEMFVLLNLCCWTGCRGQDGCLMKWENVDWTNRQISYVPEKTARKTAYRSVTLPIHPNLLSALEQAREWRAENQPGEDFILPKVAHRYKSNSCNIQKDVMKIIRCATGLETTGQKKTMQRVKNPNLYSLHSFRHTFVSFCANAGVPLDVVASIVGHGSVAMTRHYAHISDAAKSKAIDALPVLKTYDSDSGDAEKDELLKKLSSLSVEDLQNLIKTKDFTLEVENSQAS